MRTKSLTRLEKAIYEWQMWVSDFGERGQRRLKRASVLISRVGGVGGAAALQLAAAGVGRLILAHGGNLKASDLNRQILTTPDSLGKSRIACIERRLKEFNPRVEIVAVSENIQSTNVAKLVRRADIVLDCAPLFEERYLLNREAVRQNKPLVECAMYELELHLTTILPGETACLSCLYPEAPGYWKREFPVFGAVAGTVGSMGAMEAIKVLSGLGEPLAGRLLTLDLRSMTFQSVRTRRDPRCPVCGSRRERRP
jgi:molybdopterin/thiamine biosynthesis adenylyltransferase